MFKIISATDAIHFEHLKALIYGDPGIGKTSLSFTAKRPLLLHFDDPAGNPAGGIGRSSIHSRQEAVQFEKGWEDVIAFQNAKAAWEGYETLVIDTAGMMIDSYIARYVRKSYPKYFGVGGEISLKGFGMMRNIFDGFNDWAAQQKMNILYIAHATEERLQNVTKIVPDITGGSYDIIRRSMDLIGYYHSQSDKRVIDFSPRDSHIGKDCANIGLIEVPADNLPEFKTFMADVIDKTLKRMNEVSDFQTNIAQKLSTFEEKLVGLTPEICSGLAEMVNAEPIKSAQAQMADLLKKQAAKAGIEFDQKNRIWKNVQDKNTHTGTVPADKK